MTKNIKIMLKLTDEFEEKTFVSFPSNLSMTYQLSCEQIEEHSLNGCTVISGEFENGRAFKFQPIDVHINAPIPMASDGLFMEIDAAVMQSMFDALWEIADAEEQQ